MEENEYLKTEEMLNGFNYEEMDNLTPEELVDLKFELEDMIEKIDEIIESCDEILEEGEV